MITHLFVLNVCFCQDLMNVSGVGPEEHQLSSRDYSDIRDDVMNDFMIGDMQL